ncbi:hypothetical protein IFM89_007766 [Coptis chinensis]|uniref:C3H1-type domain-containing protein n=1 Tax=Coptis chinensis TaxID=261450 RepID=A0A835M901_9MAGN|nr:hypothetical protein IFM89_007766 [Coptis chinensis]
MKAVTREFSSQAQLNLPTTTATIATAEDEAIKRNTDCVYFLASPLTCKKGVECEYRHSEEARMNPRDCWYWLNGNCLNPKCSFRHPPLDGLVGTPVATPKSSLPPSIAATSTQLSVANTSAYNPVKQGTPCYYFQKGLCLKGDRCPFMHGPHPIDHVTPQPPTPKVTASVTAPQTHKKPLWVPEKCTQPKKVLQENIIIPFEVPPPARLPVKSVKAPLENGFVAEKIVPPMSLHNELPRYKPAIVSSIISGNSGSMTNRGRLAQPVDDRTFHNSKEPGEFLGEASPGFDVLVDDELRNSGYYQKEDDFGRITGHAGRHLNSLNENDHSRSVDYNPPAKFDRETYSETRGYDPYRRAQDPYDWEPRRVSSERVMDRTAVPDRRALPKAESPDDLDDVDLRHRLLKQRKTNGSRSAVSPDYRGDFYRRDDRGRHVEDQRYHGHTRRDSRHLPHESSTSNRLQGRISLPGRSSPDRIRNDTHLEKETERGRRARLSPGRLPSYAGRAHDRIKWGVQDEFNTEGRNFRPPLIRRDELDNDDFAGPKSLVQLKKGTKVIERGEEQRTRGKDTSFGEWKNSRIGKVEGHSEFEGSSSFEGPKPLREILKRKRRETTDVSGDGMASGDREENNRKEQDGDSLTVASEKQRVQPSENKEEDNDHSNSSKEEHRFATGNANGTMDDDEEGLISEEVEGQHYVQKGSEVENEDMIMLDNGDDEELETSDQRYADSDYEQVDGDFKTEEEGNADPEDEYFDEEDGDDFAKRIGVMFS